jgi:glycosyltransferase involved in cell wall biosynthesis
MVTTSPFFSVIIPTFNRGYLISKSIQSVIDQDFKDFELIIIDDGSTDNTKEIVAGFSDHRIRYLFQENKERGAARNHGTRISNGRYITFLDSDDRFKIDHLKSVFDQLAKLNFPAFFHQPYIIVDEDGNDMGYNFNIPRTKKGLVTRGNFIGCSGIFLQRHVALDYPFDEERALQGSEDYDLVLTLIVDFELLIGKEVTSFLINHEARSEIRIDPEKLIARSNYLIDKKLADAQFVKKFKKWIPAFISAKESFIALHLSLHGYKRDAWKYFWKSIKLNPTSILWKRSWAIAKNIIVKSPHH